MKTTTLPVSLEEVNKALKIALPQLNIDLERANKNSITAYYAGSLLSFGNRIKIIIQPTDSGSTELKVFSESAASIQIIDWGTNSSIETDVISMVKNVLNI